MPESKQECLQARLADSDSEVDNKFKRKMKVAQEKPVEKQKTARPPESSPHRAAGPQRAQTGKGGTWVSKSSPCRAAGPQYTQTGKGGASVLRLQRESSRIIF